MSDLEPIISLLCEMRDLMLRMERNNDTLAHKRQLKAARQARYRAKASRQSLSANHSPCLGGALAADSMRSVFVDAVDATKEGKGKRETFPPAPPIERKGESPEKTPPIMRTCARVCVCAREGLTAEREILLAAETASLFERHSPPCRFEVFAWAHRVWRRTSQDDLINEIFDDLRENGWTDPLTGKRIGNWAAYIRAILRNKLPPREVIKATLFKKKKPENVLDMTEEQIMKLWGINDEQG